MNIHPILVHFPIALLTIYALMEILRFKKLQGVYGYWYAKAFVIVIGTLSSFAAFASGDEVGGEAITDPVMSKIFEMHESWAAATLSIFSLIAVYYIAELVNDSVSFQSWLGAVPGRKSIWDGVRRIFGFIGRPAVLVLLACVGLIAITTTGALGGMMVYGPGVDPVVSFIYSILVK